MESSYDRIADGYERHWAPVLRPAAHRVLEHLAPAVEAAHAATHEPHLLDVGSGTGMIAVEALRRWPSLRVTGIDPSSGMLDIALRNAEECLEPAIARRYETVIAYADELDEDDESFDLATSSFVLQLVPSRAAALREIRRVLRPGGVFAWVAWQRSEQHFAPDRVANEVLDEFGFDPPEPEARNGDIASPAAAAAAMRKAGFRDVRAWADEVAHPWDAQAYLGFLTSFDEEALFAELEADERRKIEARILDRLVQLDPNELLLRLPVVYAMGRASG